MGAKTLAEIKTEMRKNGLFFKDEEVLKSSDVRLFSREQWAKLLLDIDELMLSTRSSKALAKMEVRYIGDLVRLKKSNLLNQWGLGRKSVSEIEEKLGHLGFCLGTIILDWPPVDIEKTKIDYKTELIRFRKYDAPPAKALCDPNIDCLETEIEKFFSQFTRSARNWEIIKKFYGIDGLGKKTLEHVGRQYGLTRERVRQVVQKFENKLPTQKQIHENLRYIRLANKILSGSCPGLCDDIEQSLLDDGIVKKKFRIDGIIAINSLLGIRSGNRVIRFFKKRFLVKKRDIAVLSKIYKISRRLIENRGVATIPEVSDKVAREFDQEVSDDFVKKILTCVRGFSFLDHEECWFWFKEGPQRSRLRNLMRKVLAVANSIDISELRSGVSRYHRLEGFSPPQRVLLELCKQSSWCSVSGNTVSIRSPIRWEDALERSSTEWALVSILKEHGPIMKRVDLQKACQDLGMSMPAFHAGLSYSPVITKFAIGVYGIRGSRAHPADIERLKDTKKLTRVVEDYGWTNDYKIWISYKLSTAMLDSGVFGVPSSLRTFLQGGYRLLTADNEFVCDLKIKENTGWNLHKFYRIRGGEAGDFVVLLFNNDARESRAYIGDIELLEDFRNEV